MKLFLVKIGRKTRSGNFQELITRGISVPKEATINDLYSYFRPRYKGLDVLIEQPEYEDIPDMPVMVKAPPKPDSKKTGGTGSLAFKIKYNEHEAALFEEYCELISKAGGIERDINDSVRERYKKLPYTEIINWYDMALTTDANGTYCNRLPIKSNDFFKVIKDCNDGTAKLEITPKVNNNETPSDIPY